MKRYEENKDYYCILFRTLIFEITYLIKILEQKISTHRFSPSYFCYV